MISKHIACRVLLRRNEYTRRRPVTWSGLRSCLPRNSLGHARVTNIHTMVSRAQLACRGYSDGTLFGEWVMLLHTSHGADDMTAILHHLRRCHHREREIDSNWKKRTRYHCRMLLRQLQYVFGSYFDPRRALITTCSGSYSSRFSIF